MKGGTISSQPTVESLQVHGLIDAKSLETLTGENRQTVRSWENRKGGGARPEGFPKPLPKKLGNSTLYWASDVKRYLTPRVDTSN
jgi:hypothetical protein